LQEQTRSGKSYDFKLIIFDSRPFLSALLVVMVRCGWSSIAVMVDAAESVNHFFGNERLKGMLEDFDGLLVRRMSRCIDCICPEGESIKLFGSVFKLSLCCFSMVMNESKEPQSYVPEHMSCGTDSR
jgi:hypothetical protein